MNCEVVKETYRAERQSYKLALKANDTCQIEWFSFPDPVKRPSHPEACGLRQLAFEVDDVDEAVGILSEKGAEPESVRIDELTGKRFTFFSDPDVLPLELYHIAVKIDYGNDSNSLNSNSKIDQKSG